MTRRTANKRAGELWTNPKRRLRGLAWVHKGRFVVGVVSEDRSTSVIVGSSDKSWKAAFESAADTVGRFPTPPMAKDFRQIFRRILNDGRETKRRK